MHLFKSYFYYRFIYTAKCDYFCLLFQHKYLNFLDKAKLLNQACFLKKIK